MSVVVVGGNDRMATRYKEICGSYKCKAKVFTQMPADFENKIGTPDLVVVFISVDKKADKHDFAVAKIHNASVNALKNVLEQYVNA